MERRQVFIGIIIFFILIFESQIPLSAGSLQSKNSKEILILGPSLDKLTEYLKSRKDNLALNEAKKILATDPNNLLARWAEAEILRRWYKFEEAEAKLKEILAQYPLHPESLISLAYIRYSDNRLSEAEDILKRLLRIETLDKENKALVYMLMGCIHTKKSKSGPFCKIIYGLNIKRYFLKAKELAPDLAEVYLGLGTFYLLAPKFAGGDIDKAIVELECAVRLAPEFATANARLAQAYKKKNDWVKFNFYLTRTKELDPENEVLKEL
ncbi:MAG: tetratricopeptide repeat protein [Candidatus Omnitrophica bacterium]|nr:tetratricopeptide repeat protein [Candidatus Omnitrophota bacterium]